MTVNITTDYPYKFRHHYHPFLEKFLRSDCNLDVHRLRIAMVAFKTDKLAFREDVDDRVVADAIQEELEFPDEMTLYASLGIFHPSELLSSHWNTFDGYQRIKSALYKQLMEL